MTRPSLAGLQRLPARSPEVRARINAYQRWRRAQRKALAASKGGVADASAPLKGPSGP